SGEEHQDPSREANGQDVRLNRNYTTTLAYEFAKSGRDWEKELRQRAKEIAVMRGLGLPLPMLAEDPRANGDVPDADSDTSPSGQMAVSESGGGE
ncbi:MAG TPA: hypothetical protein VES36_05695, partial [Candidatus Limnocylindrales bacterium]|nr:hypothetical protein [Candidatus Limnocylindrales bacterium]